MEGFSPRNLKYMRAFAQAWSEEAIVQEALAQITWYHNLTLIEKLKEREERLWYAQETVKNGWSRNVLVHWIESDLYERQGKASTNFEQSMPRRESDLARELLKDPYDFQFLATAREAEEREIEQGLVAHIREFLLELGAGFAFLGQQFKLEVGGEEFFIDLLFYHVKLRCYVVLELKAGPFKPEYAGKMNFYLSAVDDLLRHPDDKPSIGIILCKTKNQVIAEYYPGNQDPHKSLQPIRSSNSRSRLPRDQRSSTESTEIHGKENPNQLPLSVSFPGATPARRVGSFRGYAFVMIFLAWVICPS